MPRANNFAGAPAEREAHGVRTMAIEFRDGDTLVIQAELPGLDPSQEITIWVDGGVVHLRAARRCGPLPGDETTDLRGGVFSRDITLLAGHPGAVRARYLDGTLEVRMPPSEQSVRRTRRIEVAAPGTSTT